MTAGVPKLELHCHLEGVAPPDLVRRLATRNKMDLPGALFRPDGRYAWDDFLGFLRAYDLASSCIRTPDDYRDVTYEYLGACAREGAIYVETFSSPDHAANVGMDYAAHLDGIVRGIDDARRDFSIIGRIIVTCVRHLGPEKALAVARAAVAHPHPYVVGFGMGGDEGQFSCKDFAPAFHHAHENGLPCTVHAGEVRGAESVRDALDHLPVSRLGHGVRAADDPALVAELARRGTVLEVCPGSNLALGLYPSADAHPLAALIAAGCKVTLGSDDPPYFDTTIGREYDRAASDFHLGPDVIGQINQNAVDGAFCDSETKAALQALL